MVAHRRGREALHPTLIIRLVSFYISSGRTRCLGSGCLSWPTSIFDREDQSSHNEGIMLMFVYEPQSLYLPYFLGKIFIFSSKLHELLFFDINISIIRIYWSL